MNATKVTPEKALREAKSRHYVECKARNVALARQVSAALRKAGLTKASPYKTFGRDADGFLVHPSTMFSDFDEAHVPTCTVMFTDDCSTARRSDQAEVAAVHAQTLAVLDSLGLESIPAGRSWAIDVRRSA